MRLRDEAQPKAKLRDGLTKRPTVPVRLVWGVGVNMKAFADEATSKLYERGPLMRGSLSSTKDEAEEEGGPRTRMPHQPYPSLSQIARRAKK